MKEIEWKNVPTSDQDRRHGVTQSIERAKIPGGWLVRAFVLSSATVIPAGAAVPPSVPAVSITFVPDPKYEWSD
jgi:hypothetical protein